MKLIGSRSHGTIESAKNALCVLLTVAGVAFTAPALAQEAIPDFYAEPGLYPTRDYVNQHVAEHLDPFSGAVSLQFVDIFLPGNGGFDLKVVRSYNSTSFNPENAAQRLTWTAGNGWSVHFGRVLRPSIQPLCGNNPVDTKDNPVLELPDGSRQILFFTGTSPFLITAQRWRADCLGGGTGLRVYSPDGVRYDMTQRVTEIGGISPVYAWYATAIVDKNGNSAQISYAASASPQITTVTTNDGRSITFEYFDSGTSNRRISRITGAPGQVWTYEYTTIGTSAGYFLTRAVRPDGTAWTYGYNGNLSPSAGSYLLRTVTYPQGGTITYGYNFVYFNPNFRAHAVVAKTTSDGGSWTMQYTPGGNSAAHDVTVVNTPAGPITYRHWGAGTATNGNVWRFGLLVDKTIGSVQTETYAWVPQQIGPEPYKRPGIFSSLGDPVSNAPLLASRTINRNGATHTTTYASHDGYGNPTSIVESGPNGGNRTTNLSYFYNTTNWVIRQVSQETTVGVGTVSRGFDGIGNVLSETLDGVQTRYTRHSTGDIWTVTNPRGFISTYTNYVRGIPQNESHPEGVNVSRVVSTAGNVTSETNGEGRTTTYGYDGLNRVTGITPPRGAPTTISYGAASKTASRGSPALVQTTLYDGFGRPTSVSAGGVTGTYRYDVLGRKTFRSLMNSTIGQSFQYDILNRLTRITFADNATRGFTYGAATVVTRDELNNYTTYAYRAYGDPDKTHLMAITAPVSHGSLTIQRNGRDLVTSISQAGVARSFGYNANLGYYLTSATHPETGTTVYGRDAAGNMTSKQVGGSGVTYFTYDGRNRLTGITYPNDSPPAVTKTYSRTDKLMSVTTAEALRRYDYDANDNVTLERLTVDGRSMAATYGYNDKDQLASIVYPLFGRRLDYNPNVLGRPTKAIHEGSDWMTIGFWPNGQLFELNFVGGSRVWYGQNVREWGNRITVTDSSGATAVASDIWQNVAGNTFQVTDSADGAYNRVFTHDAINRLNTANGPWGSGSVTYRNAGDVATYTTGGTSLTYSYDANSRLSGISGSLSATYGYDPYGNIASASGANPMSFSYDNAGSLRRTTFADGGTTDYTYDGNGTRVKMREPNGRLIYEFRSVRGWLLAEWLSLAGYVDTLNENVYVAGYRVAERRTYFWGSQVWPSSLQFFQPDFSGSPVAATWAGGGVMWKENYKPFGEQIVRPSNADNRQWFAGHSYENAAALSYIGARYYSPALGRFMGIDPREVDPSDIHSFNRYAYGNNNPMRYVDRNGMWAEDVFLGLPSLAVGAHSLWGNVKQGNWAGAAVDVAGMVADAAAIVAPGAPGGVGLGIKATREGAEVAAQAAAKGGKNYVDGYRAVSKAEADDIAKHGFRPDPSGRSMQDKWFSETRQGAEQFRKTYPDLQEVVKTRVPRDVYDRSFKHPNIDNTGPGFCVQCADLRHLPKP
jgi:RHS repeat-associated protein